MWFIYFVQIVGFWEALNWSSVTVQVPLWIHFLFFLREWSITLLTKITITDKKNPHDRDIFYVTLLYTYGQNFDKLQNSFQDSFTVIFFAGTIDNIVHENCYRQGPWRMKIGWHNDSDSFSEFFTSYKQSEFWFDFLCWPQ